MSAANGENDRPDVPVVNRKRSRAWLPILVAIAIAAGLLLSIVVGALPSTAGIVAIAVVLTAIFWQLRAHVPSILLVFATVLLVSVVVTQRAPKIRPDRFEVHEGKRLSAKWSASGKFNEKLPIVVHIVLDEMMSTGAMTGELPGAAVTRQALLDLGEKHSFRTFDSVYSRYYYTSEVLSNLMAREYLGRSDMASFIKLPVNAKSKAYAAPQNAYFDDMAARGYRTLVFQSAYMDFCANKNVDHCETFHSFDPGTNTAGLDGPTQRVSLWQTVFRAYEPSYTSELGEKVLGRVYGLRTRNLGIVGHDGRYDVHRFPQWFDRFTNVVASVPRGTHVFAHFLVPHAPYLLLESCVLSGKVQAGYGLNQYPVAERLAKRDDFYDRYFGQIRCVNSKLDSFMTALSESEKFQDAVIIIHGDHGSRISSSDILEDFTERDFIDNYGTFFAVKAPGVPPGTDCEFVSLPEVFRRYAARQPQSTPRSGPNLPVVVVSRTAGDKKVEAPMPKFGCAAGIPGVSP